MQMAQLTSYSPAGEAGCYLNGSTQATTFLANLGKRNLEMLYWKAAIHPEKPSMRRASNFWTC